jgi:hypothetical protein
MCDARDARDAVESLLSNWDKLVDFLKSEYAVGLGKLTADKWLVELERWAERELGCDGVALRESYVSAWWSGQWWSLTVCAGYCDWFGELVERLWSEFEDKEYSAGELVEVARACFYGQVCEEGVK